MEWMKGSSILVFNCGSSSLGYKMFGWDSGEAAVLARGKAHRVGVTGAEESFLEHHGPEGERRQVQPLPDHGAAAAAALEALAADGLAVTGVGHRFVHGGERFAGATFVDDETYPLLQQCLPLAPIHNPAAMAAIEVARETVPQARQYVSFDSAFHATIPEVARTYALPKRLVERFGFRRYGFHGLSYEYVTAATLEYLQVPAAGSRMVACHLGTGGSSVAAIADGRSVDTSMGYTPLPGLVMSTRAGDVDPMLAVYLMMVQGLRPAEAEDLLNKRSGLLGVSRYSSDLRDLNENVGEGEGHDSSSRGLAVEAYVHRLRKYVGAYAAAMGGLDALVFTDDIGVSDAQVRAAVCQDMEWCGIHLDGEANAAAPRDQIARLTGPDSPVTALSVPTDEEAVIVRQGVELWRSAA